MDKSVRIWIDGKLEVDASVPESELPLLSFSSLWQETVALASKRGQPWRVEFGDQDADVNDQHWAQPSDDGESRTAPTQSTWRSTMSKLFMSQAELVLQAVQLERASGRAGATAAVATALGLRDQASVQAVLDALVASGHLVRDRDDELSDELFQDCDWPAGPLGSYALTHKGEARVAALGERAFAQVVELALRAYEQTGDVREAAREAAAQAKQWPGIFVAPGGSAGGWGRRDRQ
jgi:hypothetical protein